jgi:hypothetical protein
MRWKRAAIVLALTGCSGPTLMSKDPHAGEYKLSFHNEAGGPVCALFIYPFGQREPSNNILDANTEVASGGEIATWIAPNTYQIHADGCPYEKQQVGGYAPQVIMNADGVAVLYREDDAKSKDAAQAYVHDSHNGTMIPAKLTFNANPSKKPATVTPARTKARTR